MTFDLDLSKFNHLVPCGQGCDWRSLVTVGENIHEWQTLVQSETAWRDNAWLRPVFIKLAASSGKRNETVWCPSVCLSVPSAYLGKHTANAVVADLATWLTRSFLLSSDSTLQLQLFPARWLMAVACHFRDWCGSWISQLMMMAPLHTRTQWRYRNVLLMQNN